MLFFHSFLLPLTVQMGKTLGMEEIDKTEVKMSLKDDDVDALTAEDIIDLDDDEKLTNENKNKENENENNQDEAVEEIKEFNLSDVSKILEKLSEACDLATECDTNIERAIIFRQRIKHATESYKQLQEELRKRSKKQTKMDDYVSKK